VSIQYVAKYYGVVVHDFTFYGVLQCKAMPLQHSFYDSSGNHNAYSGFKHMDLEFSVSANFSLHLQPHIAIVSLINGIGKNAWLSQSLEYFVQDFIDISAYDYSIGSSLELSATNGDNRSKNEGDNLTKTLTIIAPYECFSFIGLDDGSSCTHHGNLILTGGNGDSLYLWKYVGDDRRVLYIDLDTETLAMKKSNG
jgi:hypothetical protein